MYRMSVLNLCQQKLMHDCDKYGIDLSKVTFFFYFIPAAAATAVDLLQLVAYWLKKELNASFTFRI